MALSDEQVRRYARHILLPDVGGVGQQRLLTGVARANIGEQIKIAYLAAAGVGRIEVAGGGAVTEQDLQSGLLYGADDLGGDRFAALARRVGALNPDVQLVQVDSAAPVASPPTLADALTTEGAEACRIIAGLARG